MRHIVLMRHAEAATGEDGKDYERTLAERGWTEADSTGRSLVALGLEPDTMICSAARRTRDTLSAILPHVGGDCVIHVRRSLYEADAADLRDALRRAQGQCVLLIAHNPAVHDLAIEFAGTACASDLLRHGFPTATAAVFTLGFGLDTVRFERIVSP